MADLDSEVCHVAAPFQRDAGVSDSRTSSSNLVLDRADDFARANDPLASVQEPQEVVQPVPASTTRGHVHGPARVRPGASPHGTMKTDLTWTIVKACSCVCIGIGAAIFLCLFAVLAFEANSMYRTDAGAPLKENAAVHSGVLDNGLRYRVLRNTFNKGRVCTIVRVRTGSIDEGDDQRGLAHFIEHMAFDSTADYPGRGAGMRAAKRSGASGFNAFTSVRNTVYFLNGVPADDGSLKEALNIHRNQILHQLPEQANLDVEKGAILGEGRFRNGTELEAFRRILQNHGGDAFRVPDHVSAGDQGDVRRMTVDTFRAFLDEQYRVDQLDMVIVGDVQPADAVTVLTSVWGSESLNEKQREYPTKVTEPSRGCCAPKQPLIVEEVENLQGAQFHLLITTSYPDYPRTRHFMRQRLNKAIFSALLNAQIMGQLRNMYPGRRLDGVHGPAASVGAEDAFNLGVSMQALSVVVPGRPHQGTWRRDLKVVMQAVKAVATAGVSRFSIGLVFLELKLVLSALVRFIEEEESEVLAMRMLGDLNYDALYLSLKDIVNIQEMFLQVGFVGAARDHVQAEGRLLFKELAGIAFHNATLDGYGTLPEYVTKAPYDSFQGVASSFNVLVDKPAPNDRTDLAGRVDLQTVQRALRDALTETESLVGIDELIASATGGADGPSLREHTRSHLLMALGIKPSVFRELMGKDEEDSSLRGSKSSEGRGQKCVVRNPILDKEKLGQAMETAKAASKARQLVSELKGIERYKLANGISLNVFKHDTPDQNHPGYLEVVALGGRSTLSPELKGSCELVNSGTAAGFNAMYDGEGAGVYFDSSRVAERIKNLGIKYPRLSCEEEYFTITAEFYKPCKGDDNFLCNRANQKCQQLYGVLESARLMSQPWFDSLSVSSLADGWRDAKKYNDLAANPLQYLDRVSKDLLSHAFPNDTRLAEVTPADIWALNPTEVASWVSEQFVPDRMEINVVGVIDHDELLSMADLVFGTIPTPSFDTEKGGRRRVGYDVYSSDPAALTAFTSRNWTSLPAPVVLDKTIASISDDRAFVRYVVPSASLKDVSARPVVAVLATSLMQTYMFNRMRRDHGFGYFCSVSSHHSAVFPAWGYYEFMWAPGNFPANADARDHLNIAASLMVARESVTQNVPTEDEFDTSKALLTGVISAALETHYPWLSLMRGLSVRKPVSWTGTTTPDPELQGTGENIGTHEYKEAGCCVKNVRDVFILEELEGVQYEDVRDFVRHAATASGEQAFALATVTTV